MNLEWSEDHARTSGMGGLSYFAHYLEATGLFEDFVVGCPLSYLSNNAPKKRDILGAILLSVLEGQSRYAHMSSLANAELDARTLGMDKIPLRGQHPHGPGQTHRSRRQHRRFGDRRLGPGLLRPASQIRALYNPRADNENCYDELKNQWGWGGFTLKDLARSELMARLIALIYNWWSIHIKLVDPLVAREAITSRPMYLMHTAKASTHRSVRTLVIFCAHSQAKEIRRNLEQAAERLKSWASRTSEQLKKSSVWSHVIAHILLHHRTIGAGKTRAPPALGTAQ